jgi:hypothetical protein
MFDVRSDLSHHIRQAARENNVRQLRSTVYDYQRERACSMKIRMNKNGIRCIHIDDVDDYEVTDDNGVDFWPTKRQLDRIVKKHKQEQHP